MGVGVGVFTAMVLFARRVAHFVTVDRRIEGLNAASLKMRERMAGKLGADH
jgi:hypothetical protein